MGDINFALHLFGTHLLLLEWIWMKFCTEMEVCLGYCVSYFGGDCPRSPAGGAENVTKGRYYSVSNHLVTVPCNAVLSTDYVM